MSRGAKRPIHLPGVRPFEWTLCGRYVRRVRIAGWADLDGNAAGPATCRICVQAERAYSDAVTRDRKDGKR